MVIKRPKIVCCNIKSLDHKVSAVFASLEPILLKYCQANVHQFNIISDSPTSQYRNKNVFWFMSKFCSLKNVSIDWICLEAGKGKGAARMVLVLLSRGFSLTSFYSILTVNLNLLQIFRNTCSIRYRALKSPILSKKMSWKKETLYQSFYPSKLQESVTRFRLYYWIEM